MTSLRYSSADGGEGEGDEEEGEGDEENWVGVGREREKSGSGSGSGSAGKKKSGYAVLAGMVGVPKVKGAGSPVRRSTERGPVGVRKTSARGRVGSLGVGRGRSKS